FVRRRHGRRFQPLSGTGAMILRVVCQRACPASVSPYQLLDAQDQSIDWANQFLDAQRLRQLSLRSLRAYAYDLLHFARWWLSQNPPRPLSEINRVRLSIGPGAAAKACCTA